MLTGELPAKKLEAPSRKVSIDARIDAIVLRALEKSPELRWQTAAELRTHVETIAAPNPATPSASTPSGNERNDSAQHRDFPHLLRRLLQTGWLLPSGMALIYLARWIREILVPTLKGGNFDQLYDLHGNVRYLDTTLLFSVIAFCWFGVVFFRSTKSSKEGSAGKSKTWHPKRQRTFLVPSFGRGRPLTHLR